jgi:uncharacterized protein with PIN domain
MAKVFADIMLSKLARWLRLAGIVVYDTPYADDIKLLKFVKKNKGILLTSDSDLSTRAKKYKVRVLFVKQEKLEKQIAYVANSLGIKIGSEPANICPICNSQLTRVDKKEVSGLIPYTAYKRHRIFYLCRKCKKTYWRGTHWKEIKRRLSKANRLGKAKNAI